MVHIVSHPRHAGRSFSIFFPSNFVLPHILKNGDKHELFNQKEQLSKVHIFHSKNDVTPLIECGVRTLAVVQKIQEEIQRQESVAFRKLCVCDRVSSQKNILWSIAFTQEDS